MGTTVDYLIDNIARQLADGKISRIEASWQSAWIELVINLDQAPIAALIGSEAPFPQWARQYIGALLDPNVNKNDALQMRIMRTPAIARKQSTQSHKFATGLAVSDRLERGEYYKNVIDIVAKRLRKSRSYVEKQKSYVASLPDFYKNLERLSPTYLTAMSDVARK